MWLYLDFVLFLKFTISLNFFFSSLYFLMHLYIFQHKWLQYYHTICVMKILADYLLYAAGVWILYAVHSTLCLYSHGILALDSQMVLEDPALLQVGCGVWEEHCWGSSLPNVSGTFRLTVASDPLLTWPRQRH